MVIIVVYGPHGAKEKRVFWNELASLRNSFDIPIIVMGDFNEVKCPEEKAGMFAIIKIYE